MRRSLLRLMVVAVMAAIVALAVAAPIASGQTSPQGQNLGNLTEDWWNWAVSTNPSPLQGSYKGGEQCDGTFVDGVFFLSGSASGKAVKRTCTVPANTPILFPVVNVVCIEDPAVPESTASLKECAENYIDTALEGGTTYATLDGQDLEIKRLESGAFTWILPENNAFGLPAGSYEATSDGLWVYLPQGLEPGTYTLEFGGEFPNAGFKQNNTYNLTVE